MPKVKSAKFMVVSRADLIREARELKSDRGENPEYDRALAELIYWTCSGSEAGVGIRQMEGSIEDVKREIGIVTK